MRYDKDMRTTLDIDDDLLQLARNVARQSGSSIGSVISELARKALEPRDVPKTRNGVPLFTPNPGAPGADLALVNTLRDDE
ncbi:MAG: hypothetical protein JWO80_666 [Bryobacterales bacterium]|nr:hypothetical protein [Bryobacterales bacterium]